MKKISLTLVYILTVSMASAQKADYKPFVVEGKVWKCHYIADKSGLVHNNEKDLLYCMQGDTIINNQAYKKVSCLSEKVYGDGLKHYYCAVRESDRQVFIIPASAMEEELLCDFRSPDEIVQFEYRGQTLYRGGVLKCWSPFDEPPVLNRMYYVNAKDEQGFYNVGMWVERVGSVKDPFGPNMYFFSLSDDFFPYASVLSCEEDGVCFFSDEQLIKPTSIKDWTDDNDKIRLQGDCLFDLQGHRLRSASPLGSFKNGQCKKGVYIRDGRKYVR